MSPYGSDWPHPCNALPAQDEAYKQALTDFEKGKAANEDDLRTAERAWTTLQADENLKAQRCKLCPNCQRVIERIDGCDTMVCGSNAHGGNQQNGCNTRFSW